MKKPLTLINFLLLIVFCIPTYLIRITIFNFPTNILEILAFFGVILTIFTNTKEFLKIIRQLPKTFLFGSIFLLSGILISIFANNNALVGLGILKGWFIFPMFFSLAIYTILKTEIDIKKILVSLYLSTTSVAIISVFYKIYGITTYDNRLSSFYLSPNQLAMYLIPGIFVGLYFLTLAISRKDLKLILLHLSFLFLNFVALYYTFSYAAWVSALVSIFILSLILLNNKKQLILTIFIVFAIIIFLFLSQKNSDKMLSLINVSPRSSLSSRITIWDVAVRLIKNNPVIGIGPGNFQSSYLQMQPYYPPYLEWAVPQPHNIFLAFWLQAGFIGFTGFFLLLYFIFTLLWQQLKNKKNTALAALLLCFFLYTILHGLVDTPYWKNDLAFLFWIFTFLALHVNKEYHKL